MPTRQQVQQIFAELGPHLELAEVHESADGTAWLLAIDETNIVVAELEEARGRVVLTIEVGVPNPERRVDLLELLLAYNAQWSRTGGVQMSLEEPGGSVLQTLALTADDLQLARLATALVEFVDICGGWREVLTREPGSVDDGEDEELTAPRPLLPDLKA